MSEWQIIPEEKRKIFVSIWQEVDKSCSCCGWTCDFSSIWEEITREMDVGIVKTRRRRLPQFDYYNQPLYITDIIFRFSSNSSDSSNASNSNSECVYCLAANVVYNSGLIGKNHRRILEVYPYLVSSALDNGDDFETVDSKVKFFDGTNDLDKSMETASPFGKEYEELPEEWKYNLDPWKDEEFMEDGSVKTKAGWLYHTDNGYYFHARPWGTKIIYDHLAYMGDPTICPILISTSAKSKMIDQVSGGHKVYEKWIEKCKDNMFSTSLDKERFVKLLQELEPLDKLVFLMSCYESTIVSSC